MEITSESTSSQLIGVECSPTFGGDSVIPAGINLTTKVYDATSVVKQIDSEESEVETGYYEVSESNLLASDSKSIFIGNTINTKTNFVINLDAKETKYILIEARLSDKVNGSTAPTFNWLTQLYSTSSEWNPTYTLSPNINIKANLAGKTDLMNKYISSIVYFFVEHNINNSRIVTQGFAMRDTETNNFGKNQTYKNPFGGNNARFYTFEYLYNKINSIRGKLKPLYFETDVLKFVKNEELDDDIKVFPAKWKGEDFDGFDTNPNESGTRFLDADINSLTIDTSRATKDVSLEYINANISSQNNIAGDSYYRIEKGFDGFNKGTDNEEWARGYIADLINNSKTLYSDVNNQKLQIA